MVIVRPMFIYSAIYSFKTDAHYMSLIPASRPPFSEPKANVFVTQMNAQIDQTNQMRYVFRMKNSKKTISIKPCLAQTLLIGFVCAGALSFQAAAEVKALFIGNSFTAGSGGTQSVPAIFDALANAAGQEDPTTVIRAVGGKDYQYHYTNSLSYVQSDQWTHMVIQNYSTEPTHIGSVADHITYGTLLYGAIITNNPNTQVHLYQTWARAEAHSLITGTSTSGTFATTDEMLGELVANYQTLADSLTLANPDKTPVIVNPVGEAWNHAGGNLPASDPDYIDLWSNDNYHGDDRGYYLSACVHYASIYQQSPEGLYTEPAVAALSLTVSDADAAFLETIAWRTVLDKGLINQTLRVDLGADSATTPDSGTAWNNLTATQGSTETAVLETLQDIDGTPTAVALSVLSRFNSASTNGTTVSTIHPVEATSDTLYGNTGPTNGLAAVAPQLKLSGLDPAMAYSLSFFASETNTADNLQTRYTVVGDRTRTVDLDAAGNVDTLATSQALYPDTGGEITVSMAPGPDNDSPAQLTLLGILELTGHPEPALAFTTQPQSQTVEANSPVTFTAAVGANRFTSFQWYRNSTPIPEATDDTYTLDAAPAGYDGSVYTVKASNGIFEVESDPATLTLLADTTEPDFLSLTDLGGSVLQLQFSEAMDPATATNPATYSVANRGQQIQVIGVTLSPDGTTVQLTLAASPTGDSMVECSGGLTDTSGNPLLPGNQALSTADPISSTTLLLDFGTRISLGSPSNTWNELALTAAIRNAVGNGTGTPHTFSDSLLDWEGTPSGIALTMTDTMNYMNASGTANGPYPAGATRDSFFGHAGTWDGFEENGQGVFVFSNLDAGKVYDFTFFGSRTGVTDNRETSYALLGGTSGSAVLDTANNVSNRVSITDITPDAFGEITLTISVGPNNDNAEGFYYLNVLEIEVRDATDIPLLLDFGTLVALASPTYAWNELTLTKTIRDDVGNNTGTPHTLSDSLLDMEGTPSGISLTMTDTMNYVNTGGTSSGPYPSGATRDSFFGNTGTWSDFVDNGQGVFVFSNLDAEKIYDFTFFGSRTGVTDNRETRYALAGGSSGTADLDTANNVSNQVSITNIVPDASGEIILTVSLGPNNDNANGFYYLNVLKIEARDADTNPEIFKPVLFESGVVVDWTGSGTLYSTEDLTHPWSEIDPVPTPPYLAPLPAGSSSFYKLEY